MQILTATMLLRQARMGRTALICCLPKYRPCRTQISLKALTKHITEIEIALCVFNNGTVFQSDGFSKFF